MIKVNTFYSREEDIAHIFCEERNVNIEDVLGSSTSDILSYTRYMIWHYLHCVHKVSVGKLSRAFNRTPASVFRGIRIFTHQMKYQYRLRNEYNYIIKKVEDATDVTPSEDDMKERF